MIRLDFQPEPAVTTQRAAAYVRMSTEHQQYSTCNQLDVIHGFAQRRNLEVAKIYSDEGKSGLRIKGRAALSQMIGDVLAKKEKFGHILVYDVSRWGRFQDPDEAAHYEFICREAGVAVHYCAEQFENDGGLTSTIAKSFKRAMAGEYSRELSTKVFQGACRMIRMGYKQGGMAPFGLRRVMVDASGQQKAILNFGERKNLQTDRVIYMPGPESEVEVVRWIFEAFVIQGVGSRKIARQLNERGLVTNTGVPWNDSSVIRVLKNENYLGNLVYSRRSFKLLGARVDNPPDQWVRKENAFPAIVDRDWFSKAQAIFDANKKRLAMTDADILEELRVILKQYGYLSGSLLKRLKAAPERTHRRFGSLLIAYRQVGFTPPRDANHFEVSHRLSKINQRLMDEILRQIEALGAHATWCDRQHLLHLNQELRIGVVFARHSATNHGTSRWVLRWDAKRWGADVRPDLAMAVRMDRTNTGIQDYYLLPGLQKQELRLGEQNGVYLDAYRFQTLDFLVGMAARVKL